MPNKLSTTRSLAILLATALCAGTAMAQTTSTRTPAAPTPIDAESLLKDFGSAERIQRSGSLRMLSQRISATACNRLAGVIVADADKYLSRSIRDYRRILAGLEKGDDGLGLYGAESDRTVLRDIAALNDLWAPLDQTFDAVDGASLTRDHIEQIASTVPAMLDTSKKLLGFVVAEYSDPSQMLQSDAVLLQIAERQRMMEQEIANAACLISEGIATDASREAIQNAVPQYTASLAALQTGMPEAGVASPPTLAIELWLHDISERWDAVVPTLEAIGAGGDVSEEDRTLIFEEMNKLTWMMNVTVGQYTEASKLQY